tara:strand:- start:52 stop:612 length:561 start_codon:yes stop_codon:yes gene_type:complete
MSSAKALARRKKRQEELALAPVNNRPVRRSDSEKRAEIIARQAEAVRERATRKRVPVNSRRNPGVNTGTTSQGGRAGLLSRRKEIAQGDGVAADIAKANIEQFNGGNGVDRGGSGANERGAEVTGYAGTVTPGQSRGFQETQAGKFPIYGKEMQAGGSFRSAFAQARGQGKKVFEWQGRKYTTDLA